MIPKQKLAADNFIANGGNASKAYRDASFLQKLCMEEPQAAIL
jgi:hypothetical protein